METRSCYVRRAREFLSEGLNALCPTATLISALATLAAIDLVAGQASSGAPQEIYVHDNDAVTSATYGFAGSQGACPDAGLIQARDSTFLG
jgi:hypothetical protein